MEGGTLVGVIMGARHRLWVCHTHLCRTGLSNDIVLANGTQRFEKPYQHPLQTSNVCVWRGRVVEVILVLRHRLWARGVRYHPTRIPYSTLETNGTELVTRVDQRVVEAIPCLRHRLWALGVHS